MTGLLLACAKRICARVEYAVCWNYVVRLAYNLGHADRREPLRGYLTGLVLPGARKSVEPMTSFISIE